MINKNTESLEYNASDTKK